MGEFKVGDVVKICKEIPLDAEERYFNWIPEMNKFRGKTEVIHRIEKFGDDNSLYYKLSNDYFYYKNWIEPLNLIPVVPIVGIDDLGLL